MGGIGGKARQTLLAKPLKLSIKLTPPNPIRHTYSHRTTQMAAGIGGRARADIARHAIGYRSTTQTRAQSALD